MEALAAHQGAGDRRHKSIRLQLTTEEARGGSFLWEETRLRWTGPLPQNNVEGDPL